MKCPKCQAENHDGVKFCEECGTRMEIECPGCGANIPLGKNSGEIYWNLDHADKASGYLKGAAKTFEEMGMGYWFNKTQAILQKLP